MIKPNRGQIGLAVLQVKRLPHKEREEILAELTAEINSTNGPMYGTPYEAMQAGYLIGLIAADIGQNPQG